MNQKHIFKQIFKRNFNPVKLKKALLFVCSLVIIGLISCEKKEISDPEVFFWAELDPANNFAFYVVNGNADYFVVFTGDKNITLTEFEPGDTLRYRYSKPGIYEAFAIGSNVSEYGKDIKRTKSNVILFTVEE